MAFEMREARMPLFIDTRIGIVAVADKYFDFWLFKMGEDLIHTQKI